MPLLLHHTIRRGQKEGKERKETGRKGGTERKKIGRKEEKTRKDMVERATARKETVENAMARKVEEKMENDTIPDIWPATR